MTGLRDEGQTSIQPAATRWLADAARALEGVDGRVDRATNELFQPPAKGLSDQHRAQIGQLFKALIGTIEDELRLRLIDMMGDEASLELSAALGSARVAIALPLLERTQLLRESDLVAAMLRRVDEHRLALALGRDSPFHVADLAQHLLDLDEPAIAESTMALLIAESRRYDQFGDPSLVRTDLPERAHRRLLWCVAAALRHYLVEQHGLEETRADLLLAGTVRDLLAEHDDRDTLEARADALAALLMARGCIDDGLLASALEEGWLALFTSALAVRAGIDGAGVWSMITDPSGMMLGTILRSIGCERDPAITMIWRIGSAEGVDEEELIARADAFDTLTAREAAEAVLIWRLDPNYRRAAIEIGQARPTKARPR